ncbi:GmrSD restriction endonuclease domain-containing protein [Bifidobacterium sp.]|uniref:GmrSD restriction endonuclease domain-containing protein n=1 Tax=Bifidobacterium sp. TaxID=41200 RepID=UPI003D7C73C8
MDAGKKILLDLFTGSLRFVVPVYQRRYSWGEAQCRQLWYDIVTAGRHPDRTHFTGSIVWMQEGGIGPDGVSQCQLIDGQQRLTSVTLLLIALAEYAREHSGSLSFSADMIIDRGYLIDKYANGENRYKLTLSGDDREALRGMCDHVAALDRPNHAETDSSLKANLDLFRSLVAAIDDANVVWNGLQRLEVVSVTLDQGHDEPQLVFESMNSTGLDLETSDLVRNYMLMGCPMAEQKTLYADYWLPMERILGNLSFDAFLHDWMVVTLKRPVSKGRAMYSEFKRFAADSSMPRMERTRGLLENMLEYAGYYAVIKGIAASGSGDANVDRRLESIQNLDSSVTDSLLLYMFAAWKHNRVSRDGLLRMLADLESYLFRRMVCSVSSNGLNKLVPSLIARLDSAEDDLVETFAALLLTETAKATRMPTDEEFRQALFGEDLYRPTSRCKYLLAGLENHNHPKDPRSFNGYTIEHIMPQNAMAHTEWRSMLGDPDRFPLLVNSLGNLTLTAYNSELSDGTFEQKKSRAIGGYDSEYLSISAELHDATQWDEHAIAQRGARLADLALQVWASPAAGERTMQALRNRNVSQGERERNAIDFAGLCSRGILSAGDVLESRYAGVTATATVTADHCIRLSNGELFDSPSGAFRRARMLETGEDKQINGWVVWKLADGRTLNELRQAAGNPAWRRDLWNEMYNYAATRADFVAVYGDLSDRKPNSATWASFGVGSNFCHPDGSLNIRGGYITVDLYFTDTFQYSKLYGMKDSVERILSGSGEVMWDEPDADKKNRHLWVRHDVDFSGDMTDAYQWMTDGLLAMRNVYDLLV